MGCNNPVNVPVRRSSDLSQSMGLGREAEEMSIVSGKIFAFISLVILSITIVYSILRARKTNEPIPIRSIAGLDALEEVVGRATESGRPIHFTTGIAEIQGETARILGGLEIMAWTARLTARYNTQMIVTVCKPSTYAVTREILANTLAQIGRPEAFQEGMARFLASDQFAYATGAANIMLEEKVAGNIMVGAFGGESIMLAESGNIAGAIQIAGDTNINQIPFFIVACDYTLLGEEMFAAGASLGNNRDVLGSLQAQDVGKFVAAGLIVLGAVLATMGNTSLADLLVW
jgi:hypothetical protein